VSDSLFSIEAALDGIALVLTFEQLALAHIRSKHFKRVLSDYSPSISGLLSLLPEPPTTTFQA
jgi:hypothetical protein